MTLKERLDNEVFFRNQECEVSYEKPDPVLVATRLNEPFGALACGLFGYGRADAIVRFLDSIDYSIIDADESVIESTCKNHYYRFQNTTDVIEFFKTLRRLKYEESLEALFLQGYKRERSVIDGINVIIEKLYALNAYRSRGYQFLIGSPVTKTKGNSPMKRWMMYLRWMVRDDNIDLGLWSGVNRADLILPLDTHTFKVSQKLGLLTRKSYDLHSAIEITCKLKEFDPNDPIKYDFALYRIGQEKIL
ncbi:MAG: TIGR02757 family protein [Campylobacterota bacterium]|nr:TIGR02757 family protein [Campylobacterota bacterium]